MVDPNHRSLSLADAVQHIPAVEGQAGDQVVTLLSGDRLAFNLEHICLL